MWLTIMWENIFFEKVLCEKIEYEREYSIITLIIEWKQKQNINETEKNDYTKCVIQPSQ